MNPTLAVVLLSGGMDSCVTCARAIEDGYDVAALHVNYGQRTQERELRSFHAICDHYGIVRRLVVDISHLAAIGGSSLTDELISVDDTTLAENGAGASTSAEADAVPTSYVPFRNANILAIATSWAEVLSARAIYIGAVEEDSSGYPDCRDVFFRAFEHVIETGTKPGFSISIQTPVIHFTKRRIVEEGIRLGAPLEHTWSCYRDNDVACGTCDSCALRLRGFQQAGIVDPIDYLVRPVY